jgi:2-polyprenyl-6-methoxyphenol hydroxylase-like FAD-dependent oxidoreductase
MESSRSTPAPGRVKSALVIGSGIAGPVAALALRKAGIDAAVYEAYGSPADGFGGVFMVAPNGLSALRIIGIDEQVKAIGQPIQRMVIEYGRGGQAGEFAGLPGLPSLVMRRAGLNRLLHDHAVASGIAIHHGKRLVSVDEAPNGITARFADGTQAGADVLIGADGIRSTVRTLIDPGVPTPAYTGLLGLGGVSAHATSAAPDAMHFAFGKRAFFGYWTGPDGRTMWFSNLPSPQPLTMTQARQTPPDEWLRRLRDIHAGDVPAQEVLRKAEPGDLLAVGALEILPKIPHWYRHRMALVGDAAHAPSPSSGQGASLAIESAVQIARCLRDLPDAQAAFTAYERLRRTRVEKIAATAARNNRQKAFGPVGSTIMSALMPIALKTFLKPEKMFGPVHRYTIDWNEAVAT